MSSLFRGLMLLRPVSRRFPSRSFATESKVRVTPPPPPGEDRLMRHRLSIIALGVGLLTFLFLLPRNDYDSLKQSEVLTPPTAITTSTSTGEAVSSDQKK